jgi:hypothetical protein
MTTILQSLAEEGHTMGLQTIGEVVHCRIHYYDVCWLIEEAPTKIAELQAQVAGHEDDSIDLYVTPERKAEMDKEMDDFFTEQDARRIADGDTTEDLDFT